MMRQRCITPQETAAFSFLLFFSSSRQTSICSTKLLVSPPGQRRLKTADTCGNSRPNSAAWQNPLFGNVKRKYATVACQLLTQSSSSFPSTTTTMFVEMFSSLWVLFFLSWRQVQSVSVFRIVGKWPTSTGTGSSRKTRLHRSLQSLPLYYFKVKKKKTAHNLLAPVLIISGIIVSHFFQVHLPP